MKIDITRPDSSLTVTMQMTEREAMVLRTIFRKIGGDTDGPRSVIQSIEHALRDQSIGYYNIDDGSIYLPDFWATLSVNQDGD